MGLAPVVVILALANDGALAGVLGALVAVPTASIIATLANEYLAKDEYEAASDDGTNLNSGVFFLTPIWHVHAGYTPNCRSFDSPRR